MRTLSAEELEIIQSYGFPLAVLVEMDLDEPLNLNSSIYQLRLGDVEYQATRGFGEIDEVRTSAGEFPQLKFAISGVPPSHIALADDTDTAGKDVRIKVAIFNPVTYKIVSTRLVFDGTLEPLVITDGPETARLEVTAESAAESLLRPITSLFSDAEQQRLYPGDLFFQFASDQADQKIVWPAASWGRQ